MKDAKGHGSNGRGGSKAKVSVDPSKLGHRIADIGAGGSEHNVQTGGAWAAQELARGNPHGATPPVHGGASGRSDRDFKNVGHGEHFNFTGERDHPFSGIAKGPWQKTGPRSYTHAETGGKYRVGTTKAKTY